MSKETVWTLRPDEDLEEYVGRCLLSSDLNRSSFIFSCIKVAGPIVMSDPDLSKSLSVPQMIVSNIDVLRDMILVIRKHFLKS